MMFSKAKAELSVTIEDNFVLTLSNRRSSKSEEFEVFPL